MKRKFINILLSALILFSNSGWAITFHYCKDTLSSVSLEYPTSASEEEEDCTTMDSCCASDDNEDETSITSSISDSTSVVKVLELQLQPFVIATPTLPILEEVSITKTVKKSITTDFFTQLNAPPLYELYCQRVFYSSNR